MTTLRILTNRSRPPRIAETIRLDVREVQGSARVPRPNPRVARTQVYGGPNAMGSQAFVQPREEARGARPRDGIPPHRGTSAARTVRIDAIVRPTGGVSETPRRDETPGAVTATPIIVLNAVDVAAHVPAGTMRLLPPATSAVADAAPASRGGEAPPDAHRAPHRGTDVAKRAPMQPRHTFGRPHSEVSNAYRPEEESWFGSYSPPADDVFDGFDDDFAGIPRTRWRSPGTPRASGASLRRRARPLLLGTARAIGVALMVVGALMAVWGFYFACIDDPFAAPRTTFNMVYGICKTFFTSGVFGVSGYLLRRVATTPARPFGWT